MTAIQPNPFTRADTFFGVCQALGDDLGFNPIFLRIAFAGLLFWNPLVALASYTAAGLIVLVSRPLAPEPRAKRLAAPANSETTVTDLDAATAKRAPRGDNDPGQILAAA